MPAHGGLSGMTPEKFKCGSVYRNLTIETPSSGSDGSPSTTASVDHQKTIDQFCNRIPQDANQYFKRVPEEFEGMICEDFGQSKEIDMEEAQKEPRRQKTMPRNHFGLSQEQDGMSAKAWSTPNMQRSTSNLSNLASLFQRSKTSADLVATITKPLRRGTTVQIRTGNIQDNYRILDTLGRGGFGTVTLMENWRSHERFAVKSIPVRNLADAEEFEKELTIFRKLNHPNIVSLVETYCSGGAYQLVMELCTGGDLFDLIRSRRFIKLGPQAVAVYLWQMLSGIAHLHHHRFAHRDIKAENYMLKDKSANAQLKLMD